jgi:uncharacterized MAPEG superfamily protein
MAKKTKNKRPKAKPGAWFVSVRGSYLPASSAGWWTYIPFVAYLIFTLIVGINDTSSSAVAILFIVPNWVAAAVVMTYIAARKS